MKADDNSDIERQLRDLVQADLHRAVVATDVDAMVAQLSRRDPRDGRARTSVLIAVGATFILAAVLTGVSLNLAHIGDQAGLPSPSESPASSFSSASPSTDVPSPSVNPTPFEPSSWRLVQIDLPAEVAGHQVAGVSPDGKVVLVVELPALSSAHLVTAAELRNLIVPGHTDGAPISAQLSPDGGFVLLSELGLAWRYEVSSMAYTRLPNPPGMPGGQWMIQDSHHALVLTGSVASHEFGGITDTQVWRLDLETLAYSELGARHDGVGVYPVADGGAVILVDTSSQHDNTGWIFYRILPDGSDHLLYDYGTNYPPPSGWAVALDGQSIAFTVGGGKTLLFEESSGDVLKLGDGGVLDFSPDSVLVRLLRQDGTVVAVDRSGTIVTSLSGPPSGWIGVE